MTWILFMRILRKEGLKNGDFDLTIINTDWPAEAYYTKGLLDLTGFLKKTRRISSWSDWFLIAISNFFTIAFMDCHFMMVLNVWYTEPISLIPRLKAPSFKRNSKENFNHLLLGLNSSGFRIFYPWGGPYFRFCFCCLSRWTLYCFRFLYPGMDPGRWTDEW